MLLLLSFVPVRAQFNGNLASAISINYPGLGYKFQFDGRRSFEIRIQYLDEDGTRNTAAGARGYYYSFIGNNENKWAGQENNEDIPDFSLQNKTRYFIGWEIDYIGYTADNIRSSGFAVEAFSGLEYLFSKNMSFQADIGPAYVSLSDSSSSLNSSGLEFVINLGVNWYVK